jgi:hypothetical protein
MATAVDRPDHPVLTDAVDDVHGPGWLEELDQSGQ